MGSRSILQLLSPFVALLAWVGLVLLLNSNGVIPLREGWADVVVPSTTSTVEIILEDTRSAEPPDTGSLDGRGALGTDSRETPTDAKVPPSVEEPVEEQVYVVKEGDSPYSIAHALGVSVEKLMEINEIEDPRSVRVGTVLTIPGE